MTTKEASVALTPEQFERRMRRKILRKRLVFKTADRLVFSLFAILVIWGCTSFVDLVCGEIVWRTAIWLVAISLYSLKTCYRYYSDRVYLPAGEDNWIYTDLD